MNTDRADAVFCRMQRSSVTRMFGEKDFTETDQGKGKFSALHRCRMYDRIHRVRAVVLRLSPARTVSISLRTPRLRKRTSRRERYLFKTRSAMSFRLAITDS
jgi:hypothetical protein